MADESTSKKAISNDEGFFGVSSNVSDKFQKNYIEKIYKPRKKSIIKELVEDESPKVFSPEEALLFLGGEEIERIENYSVNPIGLTILGGRIVRKPKGDLKKK
jgi:hypothetical protein